MIFFLIELNPAYVVAKFELARFLVEKVEQGQRLCNCVNSQIFEGYPGVGGTDEKGVVNFFYRAQPFLCMWPNLNSPDVLWKKLNRVKDCVIV